METKTLLDSIDVLWINVNPALHIFNKPFLSKLANFYTVATWDYFLSPDEGVCLDEALKLLHEYIVEGDRQFHLMGHGPGGLLALLYAYNYPEQVKSLSIFSVGVYPAIDWQAHYYAQLKALPCSRSALLKQTVYNLFGAQNKEAVQNLQGILEKDLQTALSPHNLYQTLRLSPKAVSLPLMVCCSEDDVIIDTNLQKDWQPWIKKKDLLWQCPKGGYFFHYFYPEETVEAVVKFIATQEVYNFFSVYA